MRRCLLIIGLAIVIAGLPGSSAHAEPSLQLEPLQYHETLKKSERKEGFIEVINPSIESSNVSFKVMGFRQINDKGNLSFYDDELLQRGIQLDLSEAVIPPKQALRLVFTVDSSKLPAGDVFAVIFAQTTTGSGATTVPSVQLGTLLMLTNGAPSVRQATITNLQVSWLQLGASINGQVSIKNTAPAASASGFFPEISIGLWPFGSQASIKAPLVYAGNTRTLSFRMASSQFGIYKLSAGYGASHQDRWIVVVTGVWRWISIAIVMVLVGGLVVGVRWYRRRQAKSRPTA